MKHHTAPRLVLALLSAGALFLGLSPVASAGGGNSANAKRCQKGGYANLYNASTGLLFSSEEACVAYAAQGGTFSSLTITGRVFLGGSDWVVTGFGLQPGSTITATESDAVPPSYTLGSVFPDGTFGATVSTDSCASLSVTGTTSGGATITTPINKPC